MARILGIDYGEKRTGLAVTDPLQIIVNSLETVPTDNLLEFLKNYFELESVEKIVFGQAFHADGTPVAHEKKILRLIESIQKLFPHIKIDRQDEYFTSEEAKEILIKNRVPKMKRQQKGMLDKISAVLILQKYLGHI
jgi:putative Holliday junction resolvase